jgi:hypothetical protein
MKLGGGGRVSVIKPPLEAFCEESDRNRKYRVQDPPLLSFGEFACTRRMMKQEKDL